MQILSMSIFVESYMKNYMYPSARTSDIEELIGETLKHTPPKPGGTRYKEPTVKRIIAAAPEIPLPGTQENI
ncbi:Hypothetical predicted protein [Mytilus galloprovincialis]|uniref:Uncharacterized protein n=3 Tax=Mytilus galloprovincialis TaxID=29158 RepID=A0A8B6FTG9_MYTGA|nr:Hypothetical predicted protein [Mytilus galloprovincialis]